MYMINVLLVFFSGGGFLSGDVTSSVARASWGWRKDVLSFSSLSKSYSSAYITVGLAWLGYRQG